MLFPELTSLADWGFLGLRIAVGTIFVVHGWPKITGAPAMAAAFGREGDRLTIAWMTGQGLVEAIGGVALILGVLTQLVALAFMIIMIGAIGLKLTLWRTGFMAQQTTGWEFDFVLFFASLLLFLAGPGQLALMAGGVTG